METLYRALMRLLPKEFREAYRDSLVTALRTQRLESRYRGGLGGVRFWTEVLADVLWTAARLRFRPEAVHASSEAGDHRGGRAARGTMKMTGLWNDARFVLRGLFRAPGFTVITIGTLALRASR